MGKRGKKRHGGGGGFRGGNRQGPNYNAIEKSNRTFEEYYNGLKIVDEEEKEDFWGTLRRELPNSFRFTGSRGHALLVQERLISHYVPEITKVTYNDQVVTPPIPIPWYPEKLAWSMTTPKQVIRKFPPFASFQKFLVSETTIGNISRQEVVSMIPPLLMDINPGMVVLDLCAAPGSKSAQLAEMIHNGEEARVRQVLHQHAEGNGRELSPDGAAIETEKQEINSDDDFSDDGRSTGLLIANDADYKRAQMLVHQVKRLNLPNLIITNHDASQFPSIIISAETGQPRKYLKFDRILADVPCSGDGTCRKNPNVWRDWNPGNGLGLHSLQVRILVRALQMLKVGGRVVYSTCSMNPIENESVVASAIYRCGGAASVRLLDSHNKLPGLKTRPGLRSWTVMDKNRKTWNTWPEVQEAKFTCSDESLSRLNEDMFPHLYDTEEVKIPIENCVRVYPHLQDTGGFFIAVLEKTAEIKALRDPASTKSQTSQANPFESEVKQQTFQNGDVVSMQDSTTKRKREPKEGDEIHDAKKLKELVEDENLSSLPQPLEANMTLVNGSQELQPKKKTGQQFEEPFKYLAPDHGELLKIYDFYELAQRFPKSRWMVRNATGEPVKAIYYTSELARTILTLNEGKGIKFVHCGVKMFVKQDAQGRDICRWRIQSEGMPIIEPWVGDDRVVRLYRKPTLRKLLIEMFPKVAQGGWESLGEIGERVRDIPMGCCVLRIEESDEDDGFKERMVLPLWRSVSSLNLMLPKEDRRAMLLRYFDDESPLIDFAKSRNTNTDTPNGDDLTHLSRSASSVEIDDDGNDAEIA